MFTTPLIGALKRTYPNAHLSYLVERDAAPVVAGNPHVDDLIVIGKSRGWRRVRDDARLAMRLRRERFDLVLDLHGGPRSALLTFATGAPRRIGYDIKGRRGLYTHRVHRPSGLHPRHSVVNQWDLLTAIDAWPEPLPDPARDPVFMPANPAATRQTDARLATAGVTPADTLIVVHVSAGNPFRRWPEGAFVDLVTALAARTADRRIVLSSGPSDRAAAGAYRAGRPATAWIGRGAPYRRLWGTQPRGVARRDRTKPAVRRRGHRAAPYRGDDRYADRRALWPDAGRTVGPLARSAPGNRVAVRRGTALQALRSARLCAGGLPMPDEPAG